MKKRIQKEIIKKNLASLNKIRNKISFNKENFEIDKSEILSKNNNENILLNNKKFDKIKEEEEKCDMNKIFENPYNKSPLKELRYKFFEKTEGISNKESENKSSITEIISKNNPTSIITKSGIRREFIGRYLMEKMGWRGQGDK